LRFDISHPKAITQDELSQVEESVNFQIATNSPVTTRLMEPGAAVKAGAMALFGEKYGEEVRVVSMGEDGKNYFSTELCGGTHVNSTGEISSFKILSESAVGAGVRRLEALTGAGVKDYFLRIEQLMTETASLLKIKPVDIPTRVNQLIKERGLLENELADLRRQIAISSGPEEKIEDINGISFVSRLLEGVPAKELKGLADDLKKRLGTGIVVLISNTGDKANMVVGVTDDLKDRFNAVNLVNAGTIALGGKGGGGRPDMAQAGGPDVSGGEAAIDLISLAIKNE
jgi:alanyl-tRNA synthetase